jgi:hypothetical protein
MSEYQYYEFQAIDRPLRPDELAKVRACSTRARITSTSFVNEYNWGDFRGNEDTWMARYFDAFLYVANWGTHVLKLRLPASLLDPLVVEAYAQGGVLKLRRAGEFVALTFASDSEEGGDWEEGSGRLAPLLPIRDELMRGDHRALYLGWLLFIQKECRDEGTLEPTVPPGLGRLSAAQESLAEFLRIDTDLIAVAAEASADRTSAEPTVEELIAWLSTLPSPEKDRWLAHLILQSDPGLPAQLNQRFLRSIAPTAKEVTGAGDRRTAGSLLKAAAARRADREHKAAAKAAADRARRKLERAVARERHLDSLVSRQTQLWREIHDLVASKLPKNYDQAVGHLVDLRDLAARSGDPEFATRLAELRVAHARKPTLLERLSNAGL